jgi:hypothetical protein
MYDRPEIASDRATRIIVYHTVQIISYRQARTTTRLTRSKSLKELHHAAYGCCYLVALPKPGASMKVPTSPPLFALSPAVRSACGFEPLLLSESGVEKGFGWGPANKMHP